MDKICEVDNLLLAYHKARRGKRHLPYVVKYAENLIDNILKLRDGLLSGEVEIGSYRYFYIHDPKLRKICVASFQERILHHAIMNVCHHYFERHLIYDTYATRLGKGSYAAIARARKAMLHYGYAAKLDVKSYFESIPHDVLKEKLSRVFKDKRLLALLERIIDSYGNANGCGIPIGNLVSQYFANFYLSYLDHYAKERLKVPVYVRYMDDILLFGNTAAEVKDYEAGVRCYVEKELHLKLKTPIFSAVSCGLSFLGYSLYPHKVLLNRRSKIRLKKKVCEYANLYENGTWTDAEYFAHITPLLAFSQKAYTKGLRRSLCAKLYS